MDFSLPKTCSLYQWYFRQEKSRLGLPRFSAKCTLQKCHKSELSLWSSCPLPVSYTALTILLYSSVKCKAFCTCPLWVVQSVGENLIFAYRVSLRNLLCLNVTNAREFVAQHPIVSMLHSTDHVAVFTSLVQWVLHMSSCDGTVRWEKSHFCLPSFSAKLTLLKCHQRKGLWGPTSYCQYVTQHWACCSIHQSSAMGFARVLLRWYSLLGKISFLPTEFPCEPTLLKCHQRKGVCGSTSYCQ